MEMQLDRTKEGMNRKNKSKKSKKSRNKKSKNFARTESDGTQIPDWINEAAPGYGDFSDSDSSSDDGVQHNTRVVVVTATAQQCDNKQQCDNNVVNKTATDRQGGSSGKIQIVKQGGRCWKNMCCFLFMFLLIAGFAVYAKRDVIFNSGFRDRTR